MKTNYTNYELAQIIYELNDDDFYEVMDELAELAGYHDSIETFTDWLHDVLCEISLTREEYSDSDDTIL